MQRFKKINHRLILFFSLFILLIVAAGLSIFSIRNTPNGLTREWWAGWAQNLSTDLLGAITTYLLFELIIARRQREEENERDLNRRKSWLIEHLKSTNNQESLKALDELSEYDWLFDGSLKQAFLREANLEGADLRQADLREADLRGAIFKNAQMMFTNLSGAYLVGCDFEGAKNLDQAIFDKNTRMPDGRYWKPNINMQSFTQLKEQPASISKEDP